MRRGCFRERGAIRAHFQPVAAIGGLQIVNFPTGEAQDALDGGRHVLVQAIGKLDDYYGALSRRAQQPSCYGPARLAPDLAQYDLHEEKASTAPSGKKA